MQDPREWLCEVMTECKRNARRYTDVKYSIRAFEQKKGSIQYDCFISYYDRMLQKFFIRTPAGDLKTAIEEVLDNDG